MRREASGRQPELPFAEAEGSKAELKNMLGIALLKKDADLRVAQLVLWIFNVTTSRDQPLRKSLAELGARPWGLCCDAACARATVRRAQRMGIVRVAETYVGPGIQGCNEYTIDWPGVRSILGVLPPSLPGHPPSLPGHPPSLPGHPGGLEKRGTKEDTFSDTYSLSSESESDCQRPRMADDNRAEPRMAQRVPDWLDEVPELREARPRRIAPLPPAGLVYGAFDTVRETHLADGSLVPWFRRQLGCQRPVTTDCEAELILVLAAGLAAAALPQAEVTKSRCGIFVATVNRALWPKVLKHVPAARTLLDGVLAQWPEALTAADGLGAQLAEVPGG
jgi:hypothetical protein